VQRIKVFHLPSSLASDPESDVADADTLVSEVEYVENVGELFEAIRVDVVSPTAAINIPFTTSPKSVA
jgi:hypothetical protein